MKKAGAPRPSKSGHTKRAVTAVPAISGDKEVIIDRRRSAERRGDEAEMAQAPVVAPTLERRKKVNRRRQIDPTTCERDYTDQEVEFMNALDDYKRKSGRMFPTCSEVLEVIHSLGYVKLSPTDAGTFNGTSGGTASAKPMPSDWPMAAAVQAGQDDGMAAALEPQLAY